MRRRDIEPKALGWLDRLGLGHVADNKVDSLSKGMNQKVQLIGALFSEPELCVLDEPFSGLDPGAVEVVRALIAERKANGKTTILSTHMMNQAELLCDRLAIIHQGERVVYGPTAEVRETYSGEEVWVRCTPAPPTLEGVTVHADGDGHLAALGNGWTTPKYVAALVSAGCEVLHVERRIATMEEIFLRVTRTDGLSAAVSDGQVENRLEVNGAGA